MERRRVAPRHVHRPSKAVGPYAPSPYLVWAHRHYNEVPHNLASSGVPPAPRSLVGDPPSLEDPRAWAALQVAIAAYNGVDPAEVTPTLGTSHALWLAYAMHLRAGDDVLVEEPAYDPLLAKARAFGAKVRRFVRDEREEYRLDPKRIARLVGPRTKLVVVSNLHNPTGVRADAETLRALAVAVAKKGARLLVDEVYAPFDDLTDAGGVFHGTARKLGPDVLAVGSLTKCYGLGFERVGWLLGPPEVARRAAEALTATVGLMPLSHANLASHALTRISVLAERARALVHGKRELCEAWVASRPDLRWSAPAEGLFALVRKEGAGDLLPAIEAGIRSHGVVVGAGSFFGVPDGFRISWSLPEKQLLEGLAVLDEVIPPDPPSPPRRRRR